MTAHYLRFTATLLLLVVGLGLLSPVVSFWHHEDAHHSACLEFGHIHVDENEECHGGMVASSTFLINSDINYKDLLLDLPLTYSAKLAPIYQPPDITRNLRPPRST